MPYKEKQIDDLDAGIISRLQIDGRTSNTDLAKALKVSEATIRTRLKRLTDDNVIQIVAVSNPFKLGFEVTGDLNIRVDMKKMDNVIAALNGFSEFWYIVVTTGSYNINAEFVAKNLAELHDLVYNKLSLIDGIEQIDTSIIMKYIKRRYDFGTPFN
ncbi:MAG: Lrp/AsnC family transcriptional regulator [Leptospirales bacterium]|nr:Lrp/AsnC family transcriptional regulator [Leptospirales bacterium]